MNSMGMHSLPHVVVVAAAIVIIIIIGCELSFWSEAMICETS